MNDSNHEKIDVNKLTNNKIDINKSIYQYPLLLEEDFYPPDDTRYLISGVEDISNGDNFADYASYYFSLYYEE